MDRLPDPGSTPDPERAQAFADRRASRWRHLRRRWIHVLTAVLIVVAVTLVVLALRPAPAPAALTSVRIENQSWENVSGIRLRNGDNASFVGFVGAGETRNFAVRSVWPDDLALAVSDSIVAECCETTPEASGVIVFRYSEVAADSGEDGWTALNIPKE